MLVLPPRMRSSGSPRTTPPKWWEIPLLLALLLSVALALTWVGITIMEWPKP